MSDQTYLIEPTIGVPGPASNRTVNNCRPAKSENQRWKNSAAFKCTTNYNLNRTSAEKKLVEAKNDFGKVRVSDRRSRHDIFHAKVCQIADEGACCSAISQRVSPEHPLHRNESTGEDRLEYQGQRRLSMSESAIEETKAG